MFIQQVDFPSVLGAKEPRTQCSLHLDRIQWEMHAGRLVSLVQLSRARKGLQRQNKNTPSREKGVWTLCDSQENSWGKKGENRWRKGKGGTHMCSTGIRSLRSSSYGPVMKERGIELNSGCFSYSNKTLSTSLNRCEQEERHGSSWQLGVRLCRNTVHIQVSDLESLCHVHKLLQPLVPVFYLENGAGRTCFLIL